MNTFSTCRWRLLAGALTVIATTCALTSPVLAQQESPAEAQPEQQKQQIVEPTEAQLSLNDDGVRAMIGGDYTGAIAQLERSIRLGEINVTYLNLGRAYQKLGRCAKAREALQKVKTAPAVEDPPPSEVRAVADQYLAELEESCQKADAPADPTGPDESTGPHDQANKAQGADAQVTPIDTAGPNLLGWGTTLSGVALIGGGVAMHFVAESERAPVVDGDGVVKDVTQREAADIEETADTYDTVGLAMGIGGAALVGVGAYLLLTDDAQDTQAASDGTSVWLGSDNIGISWTHSF